MARNIAVHQRWALIVACGIVVLSTAATWLWTESAAMKSLDGHRKGVNDMDFSPNGKMVATASDDTTVRTWSLSGDPLYTVVAGNARITAVKFSPSSARFVSASGNGELRIWDSQRGVEVRSLDGHAKAVNDLAFSADGSRLASVGRDRTIKIWNPDSGQLIDSIDAPAIARCVAFSPDANQVIAGCVDQSIRVWDLADGHRVVFKGHGQGVNEIDVNGDLLVSCSGDATVRLWSLERQSLLHTFRHSSGVRSVAFATGGERLVAGCRNGSVVLYDVDAKQRLIRFKPGFQQVLTVTSGGEGHLGAGGYPAKASIWIHSDDA